MHTMVLQQNPSILVTFGPQFPDLIKQVVILDRSPCTQMTCLWIIALASLEGNLIIE